MPQQGLLQFTRDLRRPVWSSEDTQVDSSLTDFEPPNSHADAFCTDSFRMYQYKIKAYPRKEPHDWVMCPYAHSGERAVRIDPRVVRTVAKPVLTISIARHAWSVCCNWKKMHTAWQHIYRRSKSPVLSAACLLLPQRQELPFRTRHIRELAAP